MLEFEDKTELEEVEADEVEVLDEDDGDNKTTSLEMEPSLTDTTDVLLINVAILLIRAWALMSKSSPSSSSSTYRNMNTKIFVNTIKNTVTG